MLVNIFVEMLEFKVLLRVLVRIVIFSCYTSWVWRLSWLEALQQRLEGVFSLGCRGLKQAGVVLALALA